MKSLLIMVSIVISQAGDGLVAFRESDSYSNEQRCGLDALCLCVAATGLKIDEPTIVRHLPNGVPNASLEELAAAANAIGLHTRGVRYKEDVLPTLEYGSLPAIIPVTLRGGRRHYLALLESRGDRVCLVNFPSEPRWFPVDDLRKRLQWDGTALHCAVEKGQLKVLESPNQSTGRTGLFAVGLFGMGLALFVLLAQRTRRPEVGSPNTNEASALRSGLTVIELMVAMSIISLLVALLLPAVQTVREAARRNECRHRLKQLCLAVHAYDSVYEMLPHSTIPFGTRPFATSPELTMMRANRSALVRLLPYLEQAALHERVSQAETGSTSHLEPPSSDVNAELLKVRVPSFECPADGLSRWGTNYRISAGVERTHKRDGFYRYYGVRINDVTDSLSQTAILSEKLVGDQDTAKYTPWRDTARLGYYPNATADDALEMCQTMTTPDATHSSYVGSTWLFAGYGHTWYNHVSTPNSAVPDCVGQSELQPHAYGVHTARSFHAGGVNVAFLDGSCRFIGNSVDRSVWRALGTINGGEPISSE